jgi:molybdate transport system ATP-binding protein
VSLEVDLSHRLGDFSLDARFLAGPGLTALFGPSGSGKTALVNLIAGLSRPKRGRIVADGEVLVDTETGLFVPRHRRRIGYVFQEARLFPHLSVRHNLLYGRWFAPQDASRESLDRVVGLLGIGHLLARRPRRLSGGETQRVAIGRALLALPRLLLLDEPLAALDAARKEEILPYIERLRDESRVPIVYVSHAVAEVARLANTVVLLREGRVEAAGAVADILSRPELALVLGEDETGAVIEAEVADHDDVDHLTRLDCAAGPIAVPRLDAEPRSRVRLRIRARDVILSLNPPEKMSALNVLCGAVRAVRSAGSASVEVRLDCGGVPILASVTRRSCEALGLAPGLRVYAIVKTVALDRQSLGRGGLAYGRGRDDPADA